MKCLLAGLYYSSPRVGEVEKKASYDIAQKEEFIQLGWLLFQARQTHSLCLLDSWPMRIDPCHIHVVLCV